MRSFSTVISIVGIVVMLAPVRAHAQQSDNGGNAGGSSVFDLRAELTQSEFAELAATIGSVLRFRQLADTATLGRGTVDLGVQFATAPVTNDALGRSFSFTRVVGRFGVSDRVDVGAWGGMNPHAKYGLAGVDARIILLREGPQLPVSVSVRPSITSLVGPTELWAGNAGVDLTVSRTFGPIAPYAGVAATSSLALEVSKDVELDPATAGEALSYAGVSYRWRTLVMSAEVEKGRRVSYAFRVGTRF